MPIVILLILLGLPLLEIAGFVLVGDQLGVFPTIGLVVLSGITGAILLRVQGFGVVSRIRTEMDAGRVPGRELSHGIMIVLAGVLLLLPGFFTDIVGLLLFIPGVRDIAWRVLRSRISIVTNFDPASRGFNRARRQGDEQTIDLDEDEYSKSSDPESSPETPWRRRELK